MTSLDTDEHTGVTIRCHDNLAVGLRLSERQLFDEDCAQYAVEVWAPGLRARVDEVAWIWDADLASFLAELVPHQATFALSPTARRRRSSAWRFRQTSDAEELSSGLRELSVWGVGKAIVSS